ncbi:MAG: DNA mismatch repair endonuclease MutL [Candidatus Krumholzibacteriia bacterium]
MPSPTPRQIQILDSATIDRIAAGEVIERPASVVKELVENALDAGARTLSIGLVDGGVAGITVEDDGAGVRFRDLPLAFERHATSKIASAADIMNVGTFGFRGEALAALASVSKVRMVSKVDDEEHGGLIELEGGSLVRREPAPRNRGTTVQVEDLFYNTPARRKFLKSGQAEKRACLRLVTTLAMAHWEVRWLLREEGQVLLDLPPAESLIVRVRDLLGASVCEHLDRFQAESGGFSVAGLASRPTWVRGNREQQVLFVNRRPVESPSLSKAIAQAYREVVPAGKFPVVIAFLKVPAGDVDVNVHPAKTAVRLLLERQVFALLKRALQEGLDLREAAPFVPRAGGGTTGTEGGRANDLRAGIAAAESDFLERHLGSQASAGRGPVGASGSGAFGRRQGDLFTRAEAAGGGTAAGPSERREDEPARAHPAPFWQLHRTYIATQIRGALVLIDQHNSHERILYNQAQKAMREGGGVPTQQLLFPAHLDLSAEQVHVFHQVRDRLQRLGFSIQPFGGQSVLVQGIPSSLKNWNDGRLLLDILDDLAGHGDEAHPAHESHDALLASFACHGAIRAGEPLTVPEMQNLVDQLFATDDPRSCPHGRPTLLQMPIEDLERRFGRR